jgi:hypothetical protein
VQEDLAMATISKKRAAADSMGWTPGRLLRVGFLKQQPKKRKNAKKRKEKREKKHRIFDLLSGLSLVDVYYYHYDYFPPLSSPHFLPSFFARVSHRHLTL